jgi:hypothetical protein
VRGRERERKEGRGIKQSGPILIVISLVKVALGTRASSKFRQLKPAESAMVGTLS